MRPGVLCLGMLLSDRRREHEDPGLAQCATSSRLGLGRDAVLDSLDDERTVEGRLGGRSANAIASVEPRKERSRSFFRCATVPKRGSHRIWIRGTRHPMPAPWGLSVTRRLPKQALSYGPIAHLSVGVQ